MANYLYVQIKLQIPEPPDDTVDWVVKLSPVVAEALEKNGFGTAISALAVVQEEE